MRIRPQDAMDVCDDARRAYAARYRESKIKKVAYSTKPYDRRFFEPAVDSTGHSLTFLETRLTADTVPLAGGHNFVCAFVNDELDADILKSLAETIQWDVRMGNKTICMGFCPGGNARMSRLLRLLETKRDRILTPLIKFPLIKFNAA